MERVRHDRLRALLVAHRHAEVLVLRGLLAEDVDDELVGLAGIVGLHLQVALVPVRRTGERRRPVVRLRDDRLVHRAAEERDARLPRREARLERVEARRRVGRLAVREVERDRTEAVAAQARRRDQIDALRAPELEQRIVSVRRPEHVDGGKEAVLRKARSPLRLDGRQRLRGALVRQRDAHERQLTGEERVRRRQARVRAVAEVVARLLALLLREARRGLRQIDRLQLFRIPLVLREPEELVDHLVGDLGLLVGPALLQRLLDLAVALRAHDVLDAHGASSPSVVCSSTASTGASSPADATAGQYGASPAGSAGSSAMR